ncbi:MAG: PAS domain-containing protein [Bdellovibrionales bacterium]|nr:PAS domain-containing protein [Bdellovibrionales bacterium]
MDTVERQNLPRRRVESRLFISILSLLLITIICTFESYQIYYSEKRNQLKAYVDSQGKLIEALFINESDIDRVMDHVVERAASFNEDFIHSRSNVDIQFILYPLFERNEAAKKSRALAWSQNSSKYKRKVWASSDPQTDMITKKILNQSGTSLSWQLFNPDDLLAHKLLPQLNMRLVGLVSVEEINKVFIHLFFKLLLIGILIGSSALLFYRYLEKRFGRFEDAARNKIEELLTNLNMFKKGMDAHSMMCKTDPSGRILQVNDRFCQTTKYSEDQLIGQNFSILSSGIHDKTFWKNFWDWINQGKVWHGSLQNKRQDGTYFWAETTVVPIDAPHRNQSGFIAIQTDVTEKLAWEDYLLEKKRAAEAANQQKNAFMAHISHEIRKPLS